MKHVFLSGTLHYIVTGAGIANGAYYHVYHVASASILCWSHHHPSRTCQLLVKIQDSLLGTSVYGISLFPGEFTFNSQSLPSQKPFSPKVFLPLAPWLRPTSARPRACPAED